MRQHYEITRSIDIEYTWDKGPIPSGFAFLKLRLQTMRHEGEILVMPIGKFWKVKAPPYISPEDVKKYEENIETTYLPLVVSGIQDGLSSVFSELLEYPIENTTIVVKSIAIDLVFSTRKSFEYAMKEALSSTIMQALDSGDIKLVTA